MGQGAFIKASQTHPKNKNLLVDLCRQVLITAPQREGAILPLAGLCPILQDGGREMRNDTEQAIFDGMVRGLAFGIGAEVALAAGDLSSGKRWGEASDKEMEKVKKLLQAP
jgi:hypothetical protein